MFEISESHLSSSCFDSIFAQNPVFDAVNYDRTEIVDTNGTYAKVIFTADPDSDVSLCLKTEHLPSIDLTPAPGIKEDICYMF